jgi:alpha-L-fucosidase 2
MWRSIALGLLLAVLPVDAGSVQGRLENRPSVQDGRDLRLWYRQPAANWNEALPIGNGRLGAMVFGGVADERLQLNEDTIWVGEKRDRLNPAGPAAVTEVRRLLAEGKAPEAEALADKAIIATPRRMPPYQPLGDVALHFTIGGSPTGYQRELDLTTAIARVTFAAGGTTYTREIFSSAVDQAIVVRLTKRGPGRIAFTAKLSREASATTRAAAPNRLVMEGQAIPDRRNARQSDERDTGVRFAAALQATTDGGRVRSDGDALVVEDAAAVTLVLTAATDVKTHGPLAAAAEKTVAAVASRPYARLRADHVADYQRLFERVSLSFDGETRSSRRSAEREGGSASAEATADRPTDERLKAVTAGASDPQLVALYFQFGRYLLISSSRPGTMAANLQGIWNESLAPSWDSKFTININTEMNYWPAEITNLSELHEPLFDLIDNAKPEGRHVAKALYGAGGFVIHHNTDLWGDAVPIDGAAYGVWPMGGAWLSLHLWEHYDFTRDLAFLRDRAYPTMKEAATFLLDYMVTDAQGRLVTGPSISPENTYILPDGGKARLCMGPTMDTEITYALFTRLIAASEILGIEPDFRHRLVSARDRLTPLKIGKYGQIQEWLEDYEEQDPGHRHMSQLFALSPGNQITPRGAGAVVRRPLGELQTTNHKLRTSSEADALRFGPLPHDEDDGDEDDGHEASHRLLVAEHLAERGLDVGDRRGEHHAELVGEAREEAARRGRRQLVDVRRDDAPRALHEELHQEDADDRGQRAEAGDPHRQHDQAAGGGGDHRAAAPGPIGVGPEREPAEHRADHREHRDVGDPRLAVAEGAEQRRVHVLRAVRHEVHRGHQQDQVEEAPRVLQQDAAVGGPVGAVLVPGGGFLDPHPDEERQQRREAAQEEHHAPGVARIVNGRPRIDGPEGERREQVAEGIAFLEQP